MDGAEFEHCYRYVSMQFEGPFHFIWTWTELGLNTLCLIFCCLLGFQIRREPAYSNATDRMLTEDYQEWLE